MAEALGDLSVVSAESVGRVEKVGSKMYTDFRDIPMMKIGDKIVFSLIIDSFYHCTVKKRGLKCYVPGMRNPLKTARIFRNSKYKLSSLKRSIYMQPDHSRDGVSIEIWGDNFRFTIIDEEDLKFIKRVHSAVSCSKTGRSTLLEDKKYYQAFISCLVGLIHDGDLVGKDLDIKEFDDLKLQKLGKGIVKRHDLLFYEQKEDLVEEALCGEKTKRMKDIKRRKEIKLSYEQKVILLHSSNEMRSICAEKEKNVLESWANIFDNASDEQKQKIVEETFEGLLRMVKKEESSTKKVKVSDVGDSALISETDLGKLASNALESLDIYDYTRIKGDGILACFVGEIDDKAKKEQYEKEKLIGEKDKKDKKDEKDKKYNLCIKIGTLEFIDIFGMLAEPDAEVKRRKDSMRSESTRSTILSANKELNRNMISQNIGRNRDNIVSVFELEDEKQPDGNLKRGNTLSAIMESPEEKDDSRPSTEIKGGDEVINVNKVSERMHNLRDLIDINVIANGDTVLF